METEKGNQETDNFIEHRPWGSYEILFESNKCKVKKITVNPGQKLSYQRHFKRSESWTIVSGVASIVLNGKEIIKSSGDVVKILQCHFHRIMNLGDENLVFIEVQTGSYFGEDDIVRYEDEYGRV